MDKGKLQYAILCTLIGIWALALLPHVKNVLGLGPITFPKEHISQMEITKMLASSLVLSFYSLCLGINELKKPAQEAQLNKRRKLIPLLIILAFTVPLAYAYVYEQGTQSMDQTILDIFLLFDNFNEHTPPEAPDGWTVSSGTWQTVTDGTTAYEQTGTGGARTISYAGSTSWTNYEFEVNVKLVTAGTGGGRGALLIFRGQDLSNYYFLAILDDLNQVRLYRRIGGSDTLIQSYSFGVDPGVWYNIRIRIEGQTINVWGNDIPIFVDVPSGGSLNNGLIALSTRYYHCRFDDVMVSSV